MSPQPTLADRAAAPEITPSDRAAPEVFSLLERFAEHLRAQERAANTVEKYLRDAAAFLAFLGDRALTKAEVIAYKDRIASRYAPAGVNSMLAAVNAYLRFARREDCAVRALRIQRRLFAREDRELSRAEYARLVRAAKDTRIGYIVRTICKTGIRVSELRYITAEAVRAGRAVVDCKNKTRTIFIVDEVRAMLREYMKKAAIRSGALFVTKSGKPLDRTAIWREMKALCRAAHVAQTKVFPHNLRHLFARMFYAVDHDIVRLADVLGHSSIETTRIYTIESGRKHILAIKKVGRLLAT